MNDPYKVLGVSPTASDDEVKQAYRKLAKQYHPDAYKDNPLADLAEEKMKEINEAYDQITRERAGGGSYRSSAGGQSTYSGPDAETYARVRQCIAANNVTGAQQLLDSISQRTAEWYFLMGSVNYQKGWMDEAYSNFRTACSMEPNNPEYAAAFRRMDRRSTAYRTGSTAAGGGADPCNICSSLLCADCLCECMGGDLIPCC